MSPVTTLERPVMAPVAPVATPPAANPAQAPNARPAANRPMSIPAVVVVRWADRG